jgi:hypothetical protein
MKSTFKSKRKLGWSGLLLMSAVCAIGWLTSAQAQQAPKPVFTLDFADGSNAVNALGQKIPARVGGKFSLQNSPHGEAMLSGPGAGYLHFPAEDIVNPQSGTVEMWVCPQDWDGLEQQFHVFFDARGQGALYLYKYYQGGLLMLSAPESKGPYFSASADIKSWKSGQWHFIAGTWSPSQNAVYVDGKLIGTRARPALPSSISGEFEIGDDPWKEPHIARTSQSLIAGVRIYDHALSAEHIAAHYAGDFNTAVPLSSKVLSVTLEHNAQTHQLNVAVNTGGADMDEATAQTQISLQQNGKPLQQSPEQKINNGAAQANFSTADLSPGTYQVVADVSAGTQTAQASENFVVPDLSWMGNKLGEKDKVLPPWMPMQVKKVANGVDVSCWGRTYQFHGAPLPTQVISQNDSMLARPIELKVLFGGQTLQWQNGQINVLESSPTHVTLQGSAEANTTAGKVLLTTNLRLEYDGLATLSLHLQKPTAWQPDAISLDIPIQQKNAIYYHRASSSWNCPAGLVPAGNGVVDRTAFQPFSWLGDDTRGLFWFCQTGEFWPNFRDENALQIVRDTNSVSIVANLVKGQKLPDDWTYDCGIEATPVKAIPADWRKWRLDPAPRAKVKIMWPTPTNDSEIYYGYPQAADDAAFAAAVKKLHDAGEAAVPYSCLTFVSSASPEYRWFEKQWDIGVHDNQSSDTRKYNASFNAVSTRQQSLQDFLIWKNLQFLKQFHVDGYYHDNSHPYGSTLADAGYGWQDGKTRQPTYGILANRELYRRLYAVTKTQDPNAFLIAHMSGKVTIPFLGFEDAILNGEQFRGKVKDSYMDVMSLAEWRAVYTGRQWGVMGYFLPEFDAEHRDLVAPTRGLAALVMLHDVSVWPIWSNIKVWDTMYNALDKFGYIESTFIPYWSPNPPASTDMKDVYISAYKRTDGRALMIVGNTSRESRSGTVILNTASLGLPVGKVLSWPDGKPLPDQNGKIQISMEGLDYRLILVGKPPVP